MLGGVDGGPDDGGVERGDGTVEPRRFERGAGIEGGAESGTDEGEFAA